MSQCGPQAGVNLVGSSLAWSCNSKIGFHLLLQHSVVRNALFCLETAWASISNSQESHVYTKALLAYAFALAGNRAKRSEVLESLNKDAVNEGRFLLHSILR